MKKFLIISLCVILVLGLGFGLLCADSALLMLCWNYAVVSAVSVACPISFWQSMVLTFAVELLFGVFKNGLGKGVNNLRDKMNERHK